MTAPLLVTGASVPGGVYPRLEIRELVENKPEQFTLFILGWERIRDPKFKPKAGQFQEIAGIHGMPYVPWCGDPDEAMQTVRGSWLGYCNHGSILFPSWHRPYIMLLEQVICDVAQGIAGEYASKAGSTEQAAVWLKAARELRFPYWDWTHPGTGTEGFPEILKNDTVTIRDPTGKDITYPNILSHYEFNESVDGFNNRMEIPEVQNLPDPDNPPTEMAYFREWKRTWRRPNSSPVNVQENYAALDADLKNKSKTKDGKWEKGSWAQLTNDVANMFNFPVDLPPELYANAWDEFSNTTFQSGRRDSKDPAVFHSPFVQHATPIEQPHNRVHLIVGGLGHMGDNDTAGFDPIFYLHHCNVDRLISFWEQIFPYYVPGTDGYLDVDGETRVPFSQAGGTYIETPSQTVDSETPLMPFRKLDNTYWTLKDTHSLRLTNKDGDPRIVQNKYYTYNPIAGVELATDDKVLPVKDREIQRGILQRHFGYNPVKVVKKNPKISFSAFSVESPSSYDTQEEVDLPAGASELEDFRQFLVEVSLSPQYHNSSYTLNLTVGTDNNHLDIGAVSVLGRGQSAGCGNCQAKRAANARVRGVIQIPHEAIVGILQARYTEPPSSEVEVTADDTSALSTEKLVRDLRLSIGSYVDLPSGKLHSELSKEVGMSESGNKGNDAAPSIRLLSCRVHKIDVGDKGEPSFGFHDWQNHGSVIGTWEKSASGGE